MKYFALVPRGSEDLFIEELNNYGILIEKNNEIIIFESEKIIELIYHALIPKKICKYITQGNIEQIDINFSEEKKKFAVRLFHPSDQNPKKNEVEAKIGSELNKSSKMEVDLENPEILFTCFLDSKKYFLGIDLVKTELDKRPYRVFNNPQSIKGNIASAALRYAGYTGEQTILDVFCRAGEIAIEAALIATKTSPFKYETFQEFEYKDRSTEAKKNIYCFDEIIANVTAAKKNAKLAGVDKSISFSKTDVSWLDTKLDENSVDLIVTQPPVLTKHNKKAEKSIEELFYQSEFVLVPEGKIVLITMNDESTFLSAKKYKFKLIRKHEIYSGQQKYNLFEFIRE